MRLSKLCVVITMNADGLSWTYPTAYSERTLETLGSAIGGVAEHIRW
jgi:hypothetical protein